MNQINKENVSNSMFIFPRPNTNAKLRVFCFPYAGGGASIYKSWVDAMPLEIELCLIQLPGRENRRNELAYRTLQALLDELVENMDPLFDKPYILFGHSMGALISFELVRKLREMNKMLPIHIFLSGLAPAKLISKSGFSNLRNDSDMIKILKELNGTPSEILEDKNLLNYFLPVFKADFELLDSYKYIEKSPLPCPITSFSGENENISLSEIKEWELYTTKKFEYIVFPGDHFFLNSSTDEVLSAFRQELRRIINDVKEINELNLYYEHKKNIDSEILLDRGKKRGEKQRNLIRNIKKNKY